MACINGSMGTLRMRFVGTVTLWRFPIALQPSLAEDHSFIEGQAVSCTGLDERDFRFILGTKQGGLASPEDDFLFTVFWNLCIKFRIILEEES
jgi:hypothetical protein